MAADETGKRYLSGNANLKALEMYLLLQQPYTEPAKLTAENSKQQIVLASKLAKRKLKLEAQLQTARLQLEQMKEQYQQCSNKIYLAQELLPKLTPDDGKGTDRLCLEIMERKAIANLKDCG